MGVKKIVKVGDFCHSTKIEKNQKIYANPCRRNGFIFGWKIAWGDSKSALKFQGHTYIDKRDMRV